MKSALLLVVLLWALCVPNTIIYVHTSEVVVHLSLTLSLDPSPGGYYAHIVDTNVYIFTIVYLENHRVDSLQFSLLTIVNASVYNATHVLISLAYDIYYKGHTREYLHALVAFDYIIRLNFTIIIPFKHSIARIEHIYDRHLNRVNTGIIVKGIPIVIYASFS